MPLIVTNPNGQYLPDIRVNDRSYEYPDGLDLKPGSKLHAKIVSEVMRRARESRSVMQTRELVWNKLEHSLTAYVPLTELERKVKSKDGRKPVSVVVPITYATLETLLTYWVGAFFRQPLFGYVGIGPEDTLGAALLEQVVDYQARNTKMALALHTMWRDAFVYGFGVVAPVWETRTAKRETFREQSFFNLLGKLVGLPPKRVTEEFTLYEGNRLVNVDPYFYLPDPNVPVTEIQRGEYVGWINRTNLMNILQREKGAADVFFNGQYLRGLVGKRNSLFVENVSQRDRFTPTSATNDGSLTTGVDEIPMYIKLIPKEWGLSDEEYPEIWLFTVAAEEIVIQAQPLNLNHGMFPVAVCAPDGDGYSTLPTSKLEVVYGLQELVDWMLSTHVANIRKALNDMFIVDPLMVNMADMANPEPGKLIRLRQGAWGRGVEGAIKQFATQDVTQQHVQNLPFLMDIISRCTGATDILQGIMRSGGERRSAEESRSTTRSALSRLEKGAKLTAIQAHQDIQYLLATQTQQLMSNETYVRVTGRLEEVLRTELGNPPEAYLTKPADILVDFDVMPGDGAQQGGENGELMAQLIQAGMTDPEIRQNIDIVRVYLSAMRVAGLKNIQDYKRAPMPGVNMNVLPTAQVGQMAAEGQLIPIQEAANA